MHSGLFSGLGGPRLVFWGAQGSPHKPSYRQRIYIHCSKAQKAEKVVKLGEIWVKLVEIVKKCQNRSKYVYFRLAAGWLAGWPAGWPVGWLAGWLDEDG